MIRTFKQFTDVIEKDKTGRWMLLIGLAIVVSLVEAAGALLLFSLLTFTASPAGEVTLPLIGRLTDYFPDVEQSRLLLYTAIGIGTFFLVRAIVVLTQAYIQSRVVHNCGARVAKRLLQGYLRMPYSFHLRRNSAEMIRNATDSVGTVVGAIFLPIVAIFSEMFVILGILVVLLLQAPLETLIAMAVLAPLTIGLLRGIQPRQAALGIQSQRMAAAGLQTMQQSLEGVKEVRIFGSEPFFTNLFADTRFQLSRAKYLRATLEWVPRVAIETAIVVSILVLLSVTTLRGKPNDQSLAILGLFAYAVIRLAPALNRILKNLNDMRFGRAALDIVHDDLEMLDHYQHAAVEGDDVLPLTRSIDIEDVTFHYEGHRNALLDIDLSIQRGESFGIVGPTGGGKSTLLDVLLGLLPPAEGRVSVDGVDIAERLPAWQRNIGFVPQTIFLVDDSLQRNVAFGVPDDEIDEEAVRQAVAIAQLETFVSSLPDGLQTVVGERGVRISGGQRQRIAIARALYRNPGVLVFDEGTSALDSVTEAELMQALSAVGETRTLIIVAHRLTTVRACDRIALLEAGKIVDVGSFDELLERNESFLSMANATR